MLSIKPDFLFDAGIPLEANIFGIGYAGLAFVIAVWIETMVMKPYFHEINHDPLSFRNRFKYSLIINTISTILGIPIAWLASMDTFSPSAIGDHLLAIMWVFTLSVTAPVFIFIWLKWIVCAFVVSVVSEFAVLFALLHPQQRTKKEVLNFSFRSNLISYAVIIILPFVGWVVVVLRLK